jgi:hypothetical protein
MTPVQKLATIFEEIHPEIFNLKTELGRKSLRIVAELMELEKAEIIFAFEEGKFSQLLNGSAKSKPKDGKSYYTQKFKIVNQ